MSTNLNYHPRRLIIVMNNILSGFESAKHFPNCLNDTSFRLKSWHMCHFFSLKVLIIQKLFVTLRCKIGTCATG